MKETNIFNNWLELDCFCYDIVEGWIKYRQSKNQEVSLDEFMNDLYPALECGFDDIYNDEFENEED